FWQNATFFNDSRSCFPGLVCTIKQEKLAGYIAQLHGSIRFHIFSSLLDSSSSSVHCVQILFFEEKEEKKTKPKLELFDDICMDCSPEVFTVIISPKTVISSQTSTHSFIRNNFVLFLRLPTCLFHLLYEVNCYYTCL
uniref:Uncharacterized protein n=1 Tax=Onchocerca volvulus TaxID=6282 RepID=A0A8R1TWK7_ONCVO